MVDENYNVWGIEINCYPDLSQITPTMQRLVPLMMEDLVKGTHYCLALIVAVAIWDAVCLSVAASVMCQPVCMTYTTCYVEQWLWIRRERPDRKSPPACGRAFIA